MTIEAQGRFKYSDVLQGALLTSRKVLIIFTALGVFLVAAGALQILFQASLSIDGRRSIAVGAFLVIFMWGAIAFRCYQVWRKSPNLQGPVQFQFDDDGYVINARHSRGEVKWSALLKWKEGKHSFLLFTHPVMASVIPKGFFSNPSDIESIRALLHSKIGAKR
ncbi:MAG: YcxB family protein [Candidatus Acidiferrales bacterium]